jgi:chromosome segregation ATPase
MCVNTSQETVNVTNLNAVSNLGALFQDLRESLQQLQLEAEAQASTIANLRGGLEDKAQEVARLETLARTLQHEKEQAQKCASPSSGFPPYYNLPVLC